MTELADYLGELRLPQDLLGRPVTRQDAAQAERILALHDHAVGQRRRRFATGLALAFVAFVEELAGQLPPSGNLADALSDYPPLEILPNGRPANTLTIIGPSSQIGLRRYYNAAEHVIISELRRYDYPNMAPHATQAWSQERAMLDELLIASPGARRRVVEGLWGRVLDLREFDQRTSDRRTPRPFEVILRDFPNTQRGEPAGAVLQGLAYAYFRADAPNVILETAKVGAGSRRGGRVGDIDGWSGGDLVLAVEVKDMGLDAGDLSSLDGFLRNLARWPDATAIVLARSFDAAAVDDLESGGVLTLDRRAMVRNVLLWDVAKQAVAVDALRYFFGKIQRSSKLVDRFAEFVSDNGLEEPLGEA